MPITHLLQKPHGRQSPHYPCTHLLQTNFHHHVPQHLRELSVSQGQSPQPEVGGGVGDGAQHKLYGVDGLLNEHLAKLKLLVDRRWCVSLPGRRSVRGLCSLTLAHRLEYVKMHSHSCKNKHTQLRIVLNKRYM